MKNKLLFGLIAVLAVLLIPFVSANILGDCDGDNSIGGSDLNALVLYTSGNNVWCCIINEISGGCDLTNDIAIVNQILDTNKDNVIDSLDTNATIGVLNGSYASNWVRISETGCQSDNTNIITYQDTNWQNLANIITENCTYVAPNNGNGGSSGGGGSSSHNHPALVTPTETRTLEQPTVEQPTQEPQTTTGPTGAATTGSTNITNYTLGGILSLAIIIAGFFLWKKYK